MEYHGKLYGKLAGRYFDTGVASEEFDAMKAKNELMEAAIKESLDDYEYLNITPTTTIIKLRESIKQHNKVNVQKDNQVNAQNITHDKHTDCNAISSATLPLKEKIIEAVNHNEFAIARNLLTHK